MKRLLTILAREYRLRVVHPSFWLLTLLVPLVLAVLYALPVWAARQADKPVVMAVVDETGLFEGGLVGTDRIHFKTLPSLGEANRLREAGEADAVLFIPLRQTTIPHDAFLYYHRNAPSVQVEQAVSSQLQTLLRNAVLEDVYQLEPSVYHSVESTHITVHTQDDAMGRESYARVKAVVAVVLCLLLVLALLLFGVQVMRAVQEERQNRTVEVLASSVRPIQLLAGKLLAVALAALTQLVLWILLTSLCIRGIQAASPQLFAEAAASHEVRALASKGEEAVIQYNTPVQLVDDTVQGLTAIRLPLVAGAFILCFLMAYLLYGSLLAALSARLDGDGNALLWSLLVLAPMLLAAALLPVLTANPSGSLAVVLTVVPFTTPVAVLARLPFGLPVGQAALGALLMLLCIAAAAGLAARSYRRHLLTRY